MWLIAFCILTCSSKAATKFFADEIKAEERILQGPQLKLSLKIQIRKQKLTHKTS